MVIKFYFFDQESTDGIWEWFIIQINTLSLLLFAFVIYFAIRNYRLNKSVIDLRNNTPSANQVGSSKSSGKITKDVNAEKVSKIVKLLKKQELEEEFSKIIIKINKGSGNFDDCDLTFFLKHGLILWQMKGALRNQNMYFLTELGMRVQDKLL